MSTYSDYVDSILHAEREAERHEQETSPLWPSRSQIAGSHYKDMAIQPAEYVTKNKLGFLAGNAIKYITRAGKKGPARQDIEKAIHCLQLLLEYEHETDTGTLARIGG